MFSNQFLVTETVDGEAFRSRTTNRVFNLRPLEGGEYHLVCDELNIHERVANRQTAILYIELEDSM